MRILVVGDVVGGAGCDFLRKRLPSLKRMKKIDLCIANGENAAQGNGLLPVTAEHLFDSGVDFITTGNHVYNRREIYDILDERDDIIRPANFYSGNPGKGYGIIDMGRTQVGVVNLLGNAFMSVNTENAFCCAERLIGELKNKCSIIVVDFHAEATGEKRAMGFFLDGKASVVFGTHTHVQTSDEQILPCGTGYITDVGMVGPKQTVLGVKSEIIISKMRTGMPSRFEVPEKADCILSACVFEVDEKTGKTVGVERISIE